MVNVSGSVHRNKVIECNNKLWEKMRPEVVQKMALPFYFVVIMEFLLGLWDRFNLYIALLAPKNIRTLSMLQMD